MGRYNDNELCSRVQALEDKVQEQKKIINILLAACRLGREELDEIMNRHEDMYKLP